MTAALLDRGAPGHAHVAARLAAEPVIWLTTVGDDARPHSVPVWFLFADPEILIFSRPDTAKVARLRDRPGVCLSLDTAASGTDVVLAEGDAAPAVEPPEPELREFGEKYREMLGDQELDGWRQVFARPLRVRLRRIVAWRVGPGGLERVAVRAG
ncbi:MULTISPECIES: pyridoxamine 5'-phosphate oxidase family protein [unclassified Pseudonocardia]|uniref:pyridoxamine 5'-phosphate oxidase family protein n=1 Tax=unclassified Pseudonocardia TaxID=2619320 RepID=UPI0001FFF0BC|nr:pyridoxamine 5'-phosphate oxidase family protein [Pseudonocardia sp. Ae707_Ps1]OLM19514.1 hypothetical protein Ae707Ps1_3773c [Pseudonocardia sp. Ae707_Ps1]